jgi:methylglutaconyl-CoA hydratase
VKIGFVPALVAVYLLRKLGEGRAKEMVLSGELIAAATAADYGLINFIADRGEIADRVREYALMLANSTSAESVKRTKQLLQYLAGSSMDEQLDAAVQVNAEARATDDFKRGIAAFLNKEKLSW